MSMQTLTSTLHNIIQIVHVLTVSLFSDVSLLFAMRMLPSLLQEKEQLMFATSIEVSLILSSCLTAHIHTQHTYIAHTIHVPVSSVSAF